MTHLSSCINGTSVDNWGRQRPIHNGNITGGNPSAADAVRICNDTGRQYGAQWFPSLWVHWEAPGWPAICKRRRREASCHLLPTQLTPMLSMFGCKPWCLTGTKTQIEVWCVYHLLLVCLVHSEVRMPFWASECLLHYFLNKQVSQNVWFPSHATQLTERWDRIREFTHGPSFWKCGVPCTVPKRTAAISHSQPASTETSNDSYRAQEQSTRHSRNESWHISIDNWINPSHREALVKAQSDPTLPILSYLMFQHGHLNGVMTNLRCGRRDIL